jgi:hypothetical protein
MPLPPPRCPTAQGAATSSLELRRSEPELSAVPSRVPGEQFPPTPSCRALIVRRGRWSPSSLPRRGPQALPRETVAAGFETKPLETVAASFEAKPLETLSAGFKAKPVKTVAAGFEAKLLETVATGFEAKPVKTVAVVLRLN